MSDTADAITEAVEKAKESRLNTIVAACVAIIATFVALCNVKDGNIVQAMAQEQAKAVDQWSYFQAKGTKLNIAQVAIDEVTLMRDTAPSLTAEQKKLYDDKIASLTNQASKYEKEKDDIKKEAEDHEAAYDALNLHDDQFDMAEALLSVAIALFGVTALTQKKWLLGVAMTFGAVGVVLGVAGFAKLNLHPDFLARFLG
ncbi:MAG TPA: DUF4337 domain-containing protein [Polyangiaceae bacterium]